MARDLFVTTSERPVRKPTASERFPAFQKKAVSAKDTRKQDAAAVQALRKKMPMSTASQAYADREYRKTDQRMQEIARRFRILYQDNIEEACLGVDLSDQSLGTRIINGFRNAWDWGAYKLSGEQTPYALRNTLIRQYQESLAELEGLGREVGLAAYQHVEGNAGMRSKTLEREDARKWRAKQKMPAIETLKAPASPEESERQFFAEESVSDLMARERMQTMEEEIERLEAALRQAKKIVRRETPRRKGKSELSASKILTPEELAIFDDAMERMEKTVKAPKKPSTDLVDALINYAKIVTEYRSIVEAFRWAIDQKAVLLPSRFIDLQNSIHSTNIALDLDPLQNLDQKFWTKSQRQRQGESA